MSVHRTPVWSAYIAVCVMGLCSSVADGQCTADCGNECDPNAVVAPDGNVHKENVAYGKNANMSGTYRTNSNPACMAVNGRTSSTFRTVSPRNCIETDDNGLWQVDLGQNYTITNITIYRADDPNNDNIKRRMEGITVLVDNQLCHQFPLYSDSAEYYDSLPEMITISCRQPLTGRILRLEKSGNEYYKIINICEVQVWDCKAGFYGANCEQCPTSCENSQCNGQTGRCVSCIPGYYGYVCNRRCPTDKCLNNRCNQDIGQCAACKTGYYGSACESCPSNCDATGCVWETGDCYSCKAGYWGEKCDKSCPTDKCLNNRCNQDNGQCAGCVTGYYGPQCQPCSSNCDVTGCVFNTGDCYSCKAGYWGEKCDESCMSDNCRDNECYQHNGACIACHANFEPPDCTICIPGKFGYNCNQPCVSSDCEDGRCDRDNGQCPACDAGFWGDNCDKSCLPRRCAGNRCDYMTGLCPTSCDTNFLWPDCTDCMAGYYGENCGKICLSNDCHNRQCDRQHGSCSACIGNFLPPACTECIAGYYTTTCDQTCLSSHCENNKCDQQTGQCSSGCEGNFSPPDCTECEDNYYGPACITQCGKCVNGTVCNSSDGTCPLGCVDGYQAPQCLAEQVGDSGMRVGEIVGAFTGGVVFCAIIAIVVFILWRRHKISEWCKNPRTATTADGDVPENTQRTSANDRRNRNHDYQNTDWNSELATKTEDNHEYEMVQTSVDVGHDTSTYDKLEIYENKKEITNVYTDLNTHHGNNKIP